MTIRLISCAIIVINVVVIGILLFNRPHIHSITITENDIRELRDDNPADREKIAEIKRMLADTNGWVVESIIVPMEKGEVK